MGGTSAVLTSVKKGDLWRVKIAWPNGKTKYFGKFRSELEAQKWIGTHSWLTERATQHMEIKRPRGLVSGRKGVADVATEQADVGEPGSERQGKD